ncbi:hypothetical protein K458DRAFT_488984 [Lentithecium fluviatile CBS 122367]|uniref:Uncharacterized protein n=1 Tax=Lentithecium fluviatile CBS 122367 TaxID=1168545 RepID=A0A6G1IV89_9PLEO|nr:hypothetical protein K458DRAFT_488984 [Lentithecium fluviatile CBS 122367]
MGTRTPLAEYNLTLLYGREYADGKGRHTNILRQRHIAHIQQRVPDRHSRIASTHHQRGHDSQRPAFISHWRWHVSSSPLTTASLALSPIMKFPTEILCVAVAFLDHDDVKACRLVCRGFRDSAWPVFRNAFGDALSDTVFDLGSQRSWDKFMDISRTEELVLYMRDLQFGCGHSRPGTKGAHFHETAPYSWDLPEDDRERLKNAESIAHPCMWVSNAEGARHAHDTGLAISKLTSILSSFPKIRKIRFQDRFVPVEYRSTKMVPIMWEDDPGLSSHERSQMCHMDFAALNILLQSLASERATVRDLAIPLVGEGTLTFKLPTSIQIMRTVVSKLASLHVYGHI